MTKPIQIQDGLVSLSMNLGRRQAQADYQRTEFLTADTARLEALWAENWIAQKVCVKRSRDMCRRWREVTCNNLNAAQLEEVDKVERKLRLKETLEQAHVWASLFGGVGILVLTEKEPLYPLGQCKEITKLQVIHRNAVSGVGQLNDNILSENYGKHDHYQINGQLTVHYSRLIILNAIEQPLAVNVGGADIFGLSDLEPVYATLKRFDLANTNVGDLITECKVDIFKMDGLAAQIASGSEENVAQMVEAVQLIKSSTNTLLLDKENEYEQKELSFGGIKDLITEFRNAVAGACDMPVTVLFGQSAAGFSSGQEDMQSYYDSIHSYQEKRLRPIFDRLDPLIAQMAVGHLPDDWWFEFVPLKEMSAEQKVNALNTFASATNTLIQNGVVTEYQVANELKENGLFASISSQDLENLANDDELNGSFEPYEEENQAEIQADHGKQANGAVVSGAVA